MSNSLQFKGYALTGKFISSASSVHRSTKRRFADPSNWSDLKVVEFKPKNFQPEDVEIAITHCGVCGSDLHTLKQGWGESKLPLIAGHEIVGTVMRVGDKVTEFKPGDRVGVGAQIGACLSCKRCDANYENYCPKQIDTYVRYDPASVHGRANCVSCARTPSTPMVLSPREDTLAPFVRTSVSCSLSRIVSSRATLPRCCAQV